MAYPRVLEAGEAAFTVEFGDAIDPAVNDTVLAFARAVEPGGGVTEVVPTYRSVTVYFDPVEEDAGALARRLRALADALPDRSPQARRLVEVPVVYGGEFGPDLADLAAFAGMPVAEAIALHASVEYRVYMLGFSPGFPYLGRVPEALAMPRLPEPRAGVPAGSVGIADVQTGIYPQASPGGWRVIGRTPLRLYDPTRRAPFLLAPGDRVRFVAITRDEFERLAAKG